MGVGVATVVASANEKEKIVECMVGRGKRCGDSNDGVKEVNGSRPLSYM
jgi:hypothetical protein